MELTKFLVKAKTATYASGNKPKIMEDGFEEFIFSEGDLVYRDRYYAKDPKPFGGEEVVFLNGKPIWMMNYYAYGISDDMDHHKVYEFLRKAMKLLTEERPFRGPASLKEGDFEYKDVSEGNVSKFKGTEKIFFKGKEVYRLEYVGGEV